MPSGKAQSPVRAATPNLELFAGSFAPNRSSDPVSTSNKGYGFSVVRNGVAGQWKVTVTGATFRNVVAVTLGLQLNAAPVTSMELILLGAVGSDGSGNTTFIISTATTSPRQTSRPTPTTVSTSACSEIRDMAGMVIWLAASQAQVESATSPPVFGHGGG